MHFIFINGTVIDILPVLLSARSCFNLFPLQYIIYKEIMWQKEANDILEADLWTTLTKVKPSPGGVFKNEILPRGYFKSKRGWFQSETIPREPSKVKSFWEGFESENLPSSGCKKYNRHKMKPPGMFGWTSYVVLRHIFRGVPGQTVACRFCPNTHHITALQNISIQEQKFIWLVTDYFLNVSKMKLTGIIYLSWVRCTAGYLYIAG